MKCPQCSNVFNKEESVCHLCDSCCDQLFVDKESVKLSKFWYNDMTYLLWMDSIKEGFERLENISDENEVDHEVFCLKVSVNALEELLEKYEEMIDR
jgi:hypothetical protein